VIVENSDTGYRYEGKIIRELDSDPKILTSEVIYNFARDFLDKKLTQYLKGDVDYCYNYNYKE
jgi:hypothetical protein